MYTRCPSCRAEICFQPPANAANLPDGYKHRIKCPSCGVTIGVKLPNPTSIAQVQPTFTPANPYAAPSEPVYNAGAAVAVPATAAEQSAAVARPAKKSGRSRNVMIFIFAALLLVCSLLGHFYADQGGGTLEDVFGENAEELTAGDFLFALGSFDGVGMLEILADEETGSAEYLKAVFEESVADGLLTVLPIIFFLLTLVVAALALIGFIVKKYPRLIHLILALGLLAVSLCILFQPILSGREFEGGIGGYFMEYVINGMRFLLLAPAMIGLLHVFFSLIFLKSLKKKHA